MSGSKGAPSPATPKEAKVLSGKVLSMKACACYSIYFSALLKHTQFMQRGALASEPASPATPASVPSSSGRSFKGSKATPQDSPAATPVNASGDAATLRAALVESEARRQQALDRQMEGRGESKWAFSFRATDAAPLPGLRVEHVGYSSLGSPRATKDGSRLVFGNLKPQQAKKQEDSAANSSSEGSESEEEANGEDGDAANGTDGFYRDADAMIQSQVSAVLRTERKRKRKEDQKARKAQAERPRKEVKLSQLSSISGGGNPMSRPGADANMDCFKCLTKGHRAANCPNK